MLLLLPVGLFAQDLANVETGNDPEIWATVGAQVPARMETAAAARLIALLPFWGENADVVSQFGEVLYVALADMEDVQPVLIDMDGLPPSIPPGGLPPYMSPRPMLPNDVSLAITGHISFRPASERWHLRLHLWRVRDDLLIFIDELVAADGEEAGIIAPFMLRWLLSRVPDEVQPPPPIPVEVPPPVPPEPPPVIVLVPQEKQPPEPQSLMYLGFRTEWNIRFLLPVWVEEDEGVGIRPGYIGAAVSFNFQLMNFRLHDFRFFNLSTLNFPENHSLGLQMEGIVVQDFGQGLFSLTLPVMLRLTGRWRNSFLSLMAGGYFFLPFGDEGRYMFGYEDELPWGHTAGLTWGRRMGRGYFTFGLRHSGDMFSSIRRDSGDFYNRQTMGVSVGYEVGFPRRR